MTRHSYRKWQISLISSKYKIGVTYFRGLTALNAPKRVKINVKDFDLYSKCILNVYDV